MRKMVKPTRTTKSRKHRVNVYFETKAQIALVLRAAKREQRLLRPNLSRYMAEAALERANKALTDDLPSSVENLGSL
jgi:hypothetical protein